MKKYALLAAAVLGCTPVTPSEKTSMKDIGSENALKVLLIGIDGVRSDALIKAKTPNLDALAAYGSHSYRASAGTYTVSGPSWSNILTGVWENKHGVKDNSFNGSNYRKFPSFLTRVEEVKPGLNTVSIGSWKINEMINTKVDKLIHHCKGDVDFLVSESAQSVLALENPEVMFVYFANVDYAGHVYGFSPDVPEYIEAIEKVDVEVGEILDVLYKREDKEKWMVIAVTDHGGKDKDHGGQSLEEKTVFYISNKGSGEILPAPTQVDVVPTILCYLRITIRKEWNLDGKSLL